MSSSRSKMSSSRSKTTSKSEMNLDSIKDDTTRALTRLMKSSTENYNFVINSFAQADIVELRQEDFTTVLQNQRAYKIVYKFCYLKEILKAAAGSITELIIVERPCECCLDSIIFRIIRGGTKLCRINFLDRLPEKHETWIKRHTSAKLIFPVTRISELAKSLTTTTLVINPVDFTSLFVPFKDFARYQSIKKLEIHGRFNEDDLNSDENIEKFISFTNRFANLTSIDASFTLNSLREDSFDGYEFYETIKEIHGQIFKGFSSNLHGVIHFSSSVNRFEDMRRVMVEDVQKMKNDIKGIWSKAATPITFDEEHSIIQRKFKIHPGLTVEFSIFAIFSNL